MKRTIPKKEFTVCDRCLTESVYPDFRNRTVLQLDAIGSEGYPIYVGRKDLCDACGEEAYNLISHFLKGDRE